MRPCPAASPPERFGGEGAPPRIGSDFVVHVVDGGVFGVREGFFRCVHDGPRVHAQMLDELALDGVAQLGGFIEQGTDLFLALAELFGPEGEPCAALVHDAGVDAELPAADGLIDLKIRRGTRNFVDTAAMTREEMELAVERGASVAAMCRDDGCNVISFGEMGIGNTSASSMWMTCLTGTPLEQCVGAGSGLGSAGVRRKCHVLRQALDGYAGDRSVEDVMRWFGGYEMVMAVGAMLQAAELGMVILVDGFIMTNCMLAASKLYPEVLNYAVFAHRGDESGHALLLDAMGAKPLLDLGLRLGEGTGAVCAYPIVESAVRMLAEMASFGDAGVTKYF